MNSLEKWKPIIEILLGDDHKYSKNNEIIEFLSNYAEHHSDIENESMMHFTGLKSTIHYSLRLLILLDLDKVKLLIAKNELPNPSIVKTDKGVELMSNSPITPMKVTIKAKYAGGINCLQNVETALLHTNADIINKKLADAKELTVYMAVNDYNFSEYEDGKLDAEVSISNLISIK